VDRGVLYRDLCEVLRAAIAAGTYAPGSKLPTEPELMAQYQISRGTVRSALDMLKRDGLVVSVPAKGTYVAKPPISGDHMHENLIAVLTPDVDTGFFSRIIRGVERQAFANGFMTIVHATNDLVTNEESMLADLHHKVAGIILAPAAIGVRERCVAADFEREGTAMVFVDRYLPDCNIDVVTSDNVRGGYIAAEHLIQMGHRRIGIGLPRECSSFSDRLEGCRQALEEAGIPYDPSLVVRASEDLRDGSNSEYRRQGELMIQQMAMLADPPTALIVPNNMEAVGVLEYLRSAAPCVHETIAVVGWDGVDAAEYMTPALTTVDQQPQEMGALAARLLMSRINHDVAQPRRFRLPVSLRVSASTVERAYPHPKPVETSVLGRA
jgi:DNA-binding LacI/PurR family transcriptional regulator